MLDDLFVFAFALTAYYSLLLLAWGSLRLAILLHDGRNADVDEYNDYEDYT